MRIKLFYAVLALITLSFYSCNKSENTVAPDNNDSGNGGGGTQTPSLKWTYNSSLTSDGSLYDMISSIPAVDENSSVYFFQQEDVINGSTPYIVTKLDSSSNEIWRKSFSNYIMSSRIIYRNNKVFFTVSNTSNTALHLFCLDANNGNTLWTKDLSTYWSTNTKAAIAVSNSKIYIGTGWHAQLQNTLLAFDFNGNLQWSKSVIDGGISALTHNNGFLFMAVNVNNYNTPAFVMMRDNGSSCDSVWTYFSGDKGGMADIAMHNGTAYYITLTSNHYNIEAINTSNYSITWSKTLSNNVITGSGGLSISNDGSLFIGDGDASKFNLFGLTQWTHTSSDLTDLGNYGLMPTIGNAGELYFGGTFGLYTLSTTDGNISWSITITENVNNIGMLTIAPNGNIYTKNTEGKLFCLKGNSTDLDNGSWAKIYGTYGNTASID